MTATSAVSASKKQKPALRGVVHQWAFFASIAAGSWLIARARSGRPTTAAMVFAGSVSLLLGVSALYHRVHWSARARRWIGRVDHAMICVLIAGSFTPFGMLTLRGRLGPTLLVTIWLGAVLTIVLHVAWYDAPKWLSAALYVVLGWVGVAAVPQLFRQLGWAAVALIAGGGLIYSLGALIYATRRPDPVPAVFGYHEVFHSLVVVAAVMHYVAVAGVVLPGA